MFTRVLFAFLTATVVLIATASAQTFENPDGRPGTFGITPVYSFFKTTTPEFEVLGQKEDVEGFENRFWQLGVSLLIPTHERVTILGSFDYTRQTVDQQFFLEGVGDLDTQTRTPAYRFSVAVRFWLGTPRSKG